MIKLVIRMLSKVPIPMLCTEVAIDKLLREKSAVNFIPFHSKGEQSIDIRPNENLIYTHMQMHNLPMLWRI